MQCAKGVQLIALVGLHRDGDGAALGCPLRGDGEGAAGIGPGVGAELFVIIADREGLLVVGVMPSVV